MMTRRGNDWRSIDELTERQRNILNRICQGKRNGEIGHDLGISPQTVKNHITAILAKTGANDRARLTYVFAQWEEVQRSAPADIQVDVPMPHGVRLTFRVFAPINVLVRIARAEGPNELFELSEEASQRLRSLLLANISNESCGLGETVVDDGRSWTPKPKNPIFAV